jgi:hypothetical protein
MGNIPLTCIYKLRCSIFIGQQARTHPAVKSAGEGHDFNTRFCNICAWPRLMWRGAWREKRVDMNWKAILTSTAIAVAAMSSVAAESAWAQNTVPQPTNRCDPGDKIDSSTANDARKKLEAAGYTDVSNLYKGCDNVWHGKARSGGAAVNVMVAPDGSVHQETD